MKEKEKLQRCLELMAVIEEEVGEARKELNNIWFNLPKQPTEKDWKRFAEEVKQIVSPLFELLQLLGYSFELKEKVEWLLKEIEKDTEDKRKKLEEAWKKDAPPEFIVSYQQCINDNMWFKNLIKKAFKGLVPKESEVGSRKTQCPSDYCEMAGSPHSREKAFEGVVEE